MNSTEIVISRKLAYAFITGSVVILAALLLFGGKFLAFDFGRSQDVADTAPVKNIDLVAGSQEKFAFLSGQGSQRSVGST